MLGNGDGTFQPPAFYAGVAYGVAYNVYAADLNNDHVPDLLVQGVYGIQYLLGNGDGSFAPAVQIDSYGIPFFPGNSIALADLNGDGKLDIAALGTTGITAILSTDTPVPLVTVVSAASLVPGAISPDSIATAFGQNFPSKATALSITDSNGDTFPTSIVYASANQINFVIPPGLGAGPATVHIEPSGQTASVLIAPVAPSLFTVNANGLAAAYVTQGSTNLSIATVKNGVYTPIPIDVSKGDTYLILFGSGIRNGVGLQANGDLFNVTYAGPQPSFAGLDQVNVLLPATLAGSGCINVAVGFNPLVSNTVFVCIQ